MNSKYCYWSVATGRYGTLMENCVRSARQVGIFQEFHVLTDRSLEGCECYDALECEKAHGLFKLHYLKVGISQLSFDYFVWLDADTVFVKNPVDILAPLGKSPLHVPLEVNLSALDKDASWRGISMFELRDLFRSEGVMNQVYLSGSSFWIVHHEAIETVYELGLRFWGKAKESGLLVDVSIALSYAMQVLCAGPEKHLLVNTRELWASDHDGRFAERSPDSEPWAWGHPLASETVIVRPAIIHLRSPKSALASEGEGGTAILLKNDKTVALARACVRNGDHFQAFRLYEDLTKWFCRAFEIWYDYGIEAAALQKYDLAERAWQTASELAPGDAELHFQIGRQYQRARLPEKARALYLRAAVLSPGLPNPVIGLALLFEQGNFLSEAREMILRCLTTSPHDELALYVLAHLDRREGRLAEAERQFRDLIGSDLKHPRVPYQSRFELARILDQLGHVDEAMKFLAEAKQILRRMDDAPRLAESFHSSAESYIESVRTLSSDILRGWAKTYLKGQLETLPPTALLGGHPRSGTTLLEQVLGSHEGVAAFDEPLTFHNLVLPHMKNEVTGARRSRLRKTYVEGLQGQPGAEAQGKLLLDKNPSLTLFLPALLQLLPELRVIIAIRDPRDVVLSCYFLNVAVMTPANATFLSFDGIARHYGALMEMWLRVRGWNGFEWTESRYEDVVADVGKEGRRITSFLGLPWQERQALFHESAKARRLYSPTEDEVTKPIYRRSIARWHKYEKYLAPILPSLKPYCKAFGYD